MPLLYLEFAAGQHFRRGSMGVWTKVHPYLAGIGVASAVTSFMVGIYYNAIIMWCFYYVANSFQYPLPWSECEKVNGTIVDVECERGGPTSYFWYRQALDISSGIDESDGIKWKMLICLIFAWGVIYACIWKGIKSSGKVCIVRQFFFLLTIMIDKHALIKIDKQALIMIDKHALIKIDKLALIMIKKTCVNHCR